MVARGSGLIIEIGDGDTLEYRGNFMYDFVKTSVIRLALAMAEDFRKQELKITALALTPGFLRSEAMLEHFGVTEANWQDGAKKDPYFIASETPIYTGRAVAALAADPNVYKKSGKAFYTGNLATEYDFADVDGTQPNFQTFFREMKLKEEAQEQAG